MPCRSGTPLVNVIRSSGTAPAVHAPLRAKTGGRTCKPAEDVCSERAGIHPPVNQHVLTRDITCLPAAQKSAKGSELVRMAESFSRYDRLLGLLDGIHVLAGFAGGRFHRTFQAVGGKFSRQNIVDGHALCCDARARYPGNKSRQPRACSV